MKSGDSLIQKLQEKADRASRIRKYCETILDTRPYDWLDLELIKTEVRN
uniref:Uncharacterized protein n=1 Tax=viral metagenome TaxID=1070528 RepID=A0A6M3LN94_9ZZZZ